MRITKTKIVVVGIVLFIVWLAGINLLSLHTKPVDTAYNNMSRTFNNLEVDKWDEALKGVASGAKDEEFIEDVNMYQKQIQYLTNLQAEEKPFYAEASALSQVILSNITDEKTYKAWGYANPCIYAGLYLALLIPIAVVLAILCNKRNEQESCEDEDEDEAHNDFMFADHYD